MERVCDDAFRCTRLVEVLVKQGQEVRPFMSRRGKAASWLLRSTNLRLLLGSDWRCRYVHACCLFFFFARFDSRLRVRRSSLWLGLRCQICPVSWGRCGSTGPSSPRRFATSWRRAEPIRRNAGTASPKPGEEENCGGKWLRSPRNHKPDTGKTDFSHPRPFSLYTESQYRLKYPEISSEWKCILCCLEF